MGLVGVAIGLAILALLNPVVGVQLYVNPALGATPICTLAPGQISRSGPAFAVGREFTVTKALSVSEQVVEVPMVTVTV